MAFILARHTSEHQYQQPSSASEADEETQGLTSEALEQSTSPSSTSLIPSNPLSFFRRCLHTVTAICCGGHQTDPCIRSMYAVVYLIGMSTLGIAMYVSSSLIIPVILVTLTFTFSINILRYFTELVGGSSFTWEGFLLRLRGGLGRNRGRNGDLARSGISSGNTNNDNNNSEGGGIGGSGGGAGRRNAMQLSSRQRAQFHALGLSDEAISSLTTIVAAGDRDFNTNDYEALLRLDELISAARGRNSGGGGGGGHDGTNGAGGAGPGATIQDLSRLPVFVYGGANTKNDDTKQKKMTNISNDISIRVQETSTVMKNKREEEGEGTNDNVQSSSSLVTRVTSEEQGGIRDGVGGIRQTDDIEANDIARAIALSLQCSSSSSSRNEGGEGEGGAGQKTLTANVIANSSTYADARAGSSSSILNSTVERQRSKPTRVVAPQGKKDDGVRRNHQNDDDEDARGIDGKWCQICLEGFSVGMRIKILPCFHSFHADCVDTWLCVKAVCPVCKSSIRDPMMWSPV